MFKDSRTCYRVFPFLTALSRLTSSPSCLLEVFRLPYMPYHQRQPPTTLKDFKYLSATHSYLLRLVHQVDGDRYLAVQAAQQLPEVGLVVVLHRLTWVELVLVMSQVLK